MRLINLLNRRTDPRPPGIGFENVENTVRRALRQAPRRHPWDTPPLRVQPTSPPARSTRWTVVQAALLTLALSAIVCAGAAILGTAVARWSEPAPAIIVTPHPIPTPARSGPR